MRTKNQVKVLKRSVKRILKSKYFLWPICFLTLVLIGLLFFYSSKKEKTVFPDPTGYKYEFYTDEPNGGNSQVIRHSVTDSVLELEFLLKEGFQSPYVGVNIIPVGNAHINAQGYNQMEIKTSGENMDRIGISLYMPPLEVSDSQDETLYSTNLNISNIERTYSIPIKQFRHPDWWEDYHHIPSSIRNRPDMGKILHLNVGSAFSSDTENRKTLRVYSITFSRNNKQLFIVLISAYLFLILANFFTLYFLRLRKGKKILAPYNPLEIKEKTANVEKSLEYIKNHYNDGDLTLEVISKETATSARLITNLINEKFGCNFKTYLNQIRINESKRFLIQTDLNMGEIAYKVGFNNQSHFNRVFKKELGLSPSEYRKVQSKKTP